MSMKSDLGTILSLSSTAILTTYVPATTIINGGRCDRIRIAIKTVTIVLTNITSIQAKVSASRDGVTYEDVNCFDDALNFGASQSYAIGAAGTAQENSLTVDGSFLFIKVQVKATGGVGQALETLTLGAQAI